jgi:glycosyltransferase involved in cell wall biosynthesis
MTASYDLGVIIPTYNRARLLSFTLESLVNQTLPKEKFQVIVADDGSSDHTCEIVNEYSSRLNLEYVYQEDKGYRPASARNLGIKACRAHICLFADSSILLAKDALEKHIRFHNKTGYKNAAIGYIYGFTYEEDPRNLMLEVIDPQNVSESIRILSATPVFHDVRNSHYLKYNDQIRHLPAPWVYFWTSHVSVPRQKLLDINGFDENYDGRWGVEDQDLGYRLYKDGVGIYLLRAAESIHYPHSYNAKQKLEDGIENCKYFYNKFPTKEHELFLEHYLSPDLVDINELVFKFEVA